MSPKDTLMLWDEKESASVCERVADGLSQDAYAVVDNFLDGAQVRAIRSHIDALLAQDGFKQAGIGAAHQFQVNEAIRKDLIHWLDPKDAATQAVLKEFIQRLNKLMSYINRTCYLGLKDVEMHYAIYRPGAYYKRHLDQFKNNDHRRLTFLCYLNDDWREDNGGLLRLFLKNGEGPEKNLDIMPTGGRLVCFRSDRLEHEVLLCNRQRYSLTGWMLDRLNDMTFLT